MRVWRVSCWASWLAILLWIPSVSAAQEPGRTGDSVETPAPMRSALEIQIQAPFTFVRAIYSSAGSRAPWATDYPDADRAFSTEFERLAGLPTNLDGLTLELTDPALLDYPFIYIVEPGQMALSEPEIDALRQYLLSGGFLMMDDFHGEYEWAIVRHWIHQIFPDRELIELARDHEIFWSFYAMSEQPQIPGRGGIRRGTEPKYWGLFGDDGQLIAVLCHNSDFGDGWEHLGDPWYPEELSVGQAVPLGVNIVIYALTH